MVFSLGDMNLTVICIDGNRKSLWNHFEIGASGGTILTQKDTSVREWHGGVFAF